MAASQCPKCSHLFDVRDGFGDLLPLAYCSACDSHYPQRMGACKWCGTTPEPPPNTPRLWKTVGAVALVALVGIAWLLRDAGEESPAIANPTAVATRPAEVVSTVPSAVAQQPDSVPIALESIPVSTPIAAEVSDTQPTTVAVSELVRTPDATPPKAHAAAPSAKWVNSVARDWAVVRSGPSKSTRIVASVGPGARVQLGESQGTWRRIRTRGIAGWVEPRTAFATAASSVTWSRQVVSR